MVQNIIYMLISTVSDLDILGVDIEPFWEVIKLAKEPDLFLLAGDIYEFRNPEIYGLIIDFFKLKKWNCPIIAVFGNREFDEDLDEIKKICKNRITFLDDESIELKIKDKKVGIVGTRGSLDVPTWWQSTHVPDIRKAYLERIKKCEELLEKLKVDIKILLSHYAPTYKTLVGEDKKIYSSLGSRKFEDTLIKTKINFAVHGHAHYGTSLAFVDSIPVFNVAFNISRKIVEIDPYNLPKPGLHKFVK
jgi:Icc-related predicted phosphoesterase